ncbi:MAG TPA: lysophospholipid acyltransferase family protein [Gemmatimonadaceae bacterium]|nr:lysophospholipid acyltransferase family protein [Gemmatimonadaceae bacterium]
MIPAPRVVRFAVRLLRVVPIAPVRWVARAAGAVAFTVARGRRATLLENQAHLSPNVSPAARRRLARRTLMNLLDAAVDLFRVPSMRPGELAALVAVSGREHLDAARALGKGVVVVTPHLGPYELGGAWLAVMGYPVHAMVEEIDPETNAALALYREATGMKLISRSRGVRGALRLLHEGQLVLLVADRVVGEGGEGVPVFLGDGVRAVPTGPATLALATGAPIVVGHIARATSGKARYLVQLEPPIIAEGTGHASRDREALTRRVAERLAAAVLSHPDQWYVFQPKWLPRDALD